MKLMYYSKNQELDDGGIKLNSGIIEESNTTTGPLLSTTTTIPYSRPVLEERKFFSTIIENVIANLTRLMKDKDLARLFENCWPNTLDTTVAWTKFDGNYPKTFIITGDIPAMWLRDSTNQVISYVPFANQDNELKQLILGLIYMQAEFIVEDPYSNAFRAPNETNIPYEENPWSKTDKVIPKPSNSTWESKWEVDSLASFLKLSFNYWQSTKDERFLKMEIWKKAVTTILETFEIQRLGTFEELNNEHYLFTRETRTSTETLLLYGKGNPVRRTGLIKSQFRPSDDSTTFPFLIPSNAMASVELEHLSKMLNKTYPDLAKKAFEMAIDIRTAIVSLSIVHHQKFREIFVYEIDGYGSTNLMDDANIPSLLSLPYLGFLDKNDQIYQNTRQFILSDWNKYYFENFQEGQQQQKYKGVGSPHSGLGYIWPMSLCVKILTSTDDQEILDTLEYLKSSSSNTGLIHESFWYKDSNNFTRPWFARKKIRSEEYQQVD
ncbi:11059_t:CDS:2 [Entrophospora sp. SA101]|nr:11059_t:CDS:2 [Entrophospora sp. SA101]